ncbi:MAG: 30S ribosomal protein S9 [Candidatus Marinimicrobia bacterium]|nr:30S ribosomal protein S9 [Candidatus Neomarinimicrobiota bacterium]
MTKAVYQATGRRKRAVARVLLMPGKGNILVNGNPYQEYLSRDTISKIVIEPLDVVEQNNAYDISVNVKGGGLTGQAGAIRLGIARALLQINSDFRPVLKKAGLLTRDSRQVERKKYGQPGARKRFQFSKR